MKKNTHRKQRGMSPKEDWLLRQLKLPRVDFDTAIAVVDGTWPADRRDTVPSKGGKR